MSTEPKPRKAEQVYTSQGGLASWETPLLPLMQRVHKHWRQMLVHVWGPAGSVVFHVIAIGSLLTLMPNPPVEYQPSGPIEIATIHTKEPLEPPPVVTPTTKPLPPATTTDAPDLPGCDIPGVSSQPVDDAGVGNNPNDGAGMGDRPEELPNRFEIDTHTPSRLIFRKLVTGPAGSGRRDRLTQYIVGNTPRARENEQAVLRSLRWLKREQQPDGSWIGSKQDVRPAMTSMALLAFLAHAETPDAPEFGNTVKQGIEWLLANQESGGHFKGRDSNDYSQPIAAYALCEAYGMTGHPQVKEAAIKAISLVVQGQHASGGFNYKLDQSLRNDSSYMGWCCQALKSAKMAKLADVVPGLDAAMKKSVVGFKFNADPNGGFGYEGSGRTGLSGAGALCMQLLGAPKAPEVVNTIKFLDTCTFSFATPDQQPYGSGSQLYYWYYITQAKFHHSPEVFAAWNKQFAPELCSTQIREPKAIAALDGKMVDVGHWESPCKGEHTGGLVQDTALCTLMLEVYYSKLPTFQHVEAEPSILSSGAKPNDDITIQVR